VLIDLNKLDLVKSITRTQAKAVHKELPPGGVWRTINGHHIYIKNGKILAGSIPGVTKAKKMTKQQMSEHQATVDREAKKGTKKGVKNDKKDKTSTKTKRPETQRAGASKTDKGKTAKETSRSTKSKTKGAVTNEVSKGAKKAPTGVQRGTKPKSADKPPAGKTTKQGTAKSGEKGKKVTPKTSTKKDPNEEHLRNLAGRSDNGTDMFMNASENPKEYEALKEALKTAEGEKASDKLNYLHAKYGGGREVPEYKPANPKEITDFKLGKAKFKPSDIKMTTSDSHRAEASADFEGNVIFRSNMLKQPMETQKHVMIHEIGHVISNAYPNLEKHIMSNPQDGLGKTNQKAGRFEGVSYSPEESWAESFARYHTEPKVFKKKYPTQYNFVEQVLKKIPNYKEFVDKGLEELNRLNGVKGAKKDEKPSKPATQAKSKGTRKAVPGAEKTTSESGNSSKKPKVNDIRSDAQKNRELAYDVGEKVGGARKDEFIASFKEKPTYQSLEELEKMSGAIAEKMVTKANLLPTTSFEQDYENGVELTTSAMRRLIFERIAPKPDPSTPETRKAYMNAMTKLNRQLAGIKTWDNMKNAIRELSEYARNTSTKYMESTANSIHYFDKESRGESWSPVTEESKAKALERKKEYEAKLAQRTKEKEAFNFEALGEKLNNFFTNWDSMNRTFKTVQKNTVEGWDKYLNPQAKKKAPKKKGDENKVWERQAEAEDLRTGGKKIKIDKPEQLMKDFGLRGVEFGNWVNDSSGKYHLQRSAEALSDLAGILGINPKDISLNGRLAIAFGARGKAGALAHYEADRKVINMTKYGGAGSLAHEWGHAMDNILYQYSNGGAESLGWASDGQMGNSDPKLKALYDNLMDAISKPAPGEKGGSHQLILDSSQKQMSRYYPEMRKQIGEKGYKTEDVYHHWANKINAQYDRHIEHIKNNMLRNPADREKAIKKYEQKRKRELNDLPHYLAQELRRKQNGGYGGDHYQGHIEVPTGKSEYMSRMEDTQPNKTQNGAHYWSQPAEVFARVFESYIEHKMKQSGQYNNYLVHGTTEGHVKVEGAPFPIGKEREHMFKAMENLLAHISKGKALEKALILDILASGSGDRTEELRKSLGYTKRSAYNVANPEDVIYIPVNRLRTPYQTEEATNMDKVNENYDRMQAGENLEPVSIGLDYDVHDGHHRIEASKKAGHEHIPCIVKGGNELERQRAIEAYKGVWKSINTDSLVANFNKVLEATGNKEEAFNYTIEDTKIKLWEDLKKLGQEVPKELVTKSIAPDPVAPDAFEEDSRYMYRGIGQKELDFIKKNGYIQTKGKGNDEDKDKATCFSNLYRQAVGYALSNYALYDEPNAYVIALPKYPFVKEDETGELVSHHPVPTYDMKVIPIPKEEIVK